MKKEKAIVSLIITIIMLIIMMCIKEAREGIIAQPFLIKIVFVASIYVGVGTFATVITISFRILRWIFDKLSGN